MSKWGDTKRLVYERDNGQCAFCGERAVDCHHIVLKSLGGKNDERNLISLCRACHETVHSDTKYYTPILFERQTNFYCDLTMNDLKQDSKYKGFKYE